MSNAISSAAAPAPKAKPPRPASKIPLVPWRPWVGVLFVGIIYFGSQAIGAILISVYPFLKGWSHARAADWADNSVWAQFVFVLLAEAVTVGSIYLFLKYKRQGLGLIGLKKPRLRDPLYGLLAVPVYFAIYAVAVDVVSALVPGLNVNQQQQIGFNSVQGPLELTVTFISLVVLPPLAEEIMVRGFLYSTLKKAMPAVAAVLTTSALFAAAHLPEGGPAGPLYIAAIDTFVLSLVLIYLREKTGSLWASITLHASKNFIAFIALFVLHAH